MRYYISCVVILLALGATACHSPSKNTKATANAELTEAELLASVTEENKALYYSLDAEGKTLALKLASPSLADIEVNGKKMQTATVADRNLAIKTAAKVSPAKRHDIGDDGSAKHEDTASKDTVTTWHTSWNAGQ